MQDRFSAEESENDLFTNKLSELKPDKISQVLDLLKEKFFSLEEVANNIDFTEMLARISRYKKSFQKQELQSYGFSIYAWLESFAYLSKQRWHPPAKCLKNAAIFCCLCHHLYARSVHNYLQTMQDLEVINKNVYEQFKNGSHEVRRTRRFWGGLSRDLIIEQVISIM